MSGKKKFKSGSGSVEHVVQIIDHYQMCACERSANGIQCLETALSEMVALDYNGYGLTAAAGDMVYWFAQQLPEELRATLEEVRLGITIDDWCAKWRREHPVFIWTTNRKTADRLKPVLAFA